MSNAELKAWEVLLEVLAKQPDVSPRDEGRLAETLDALRREHEREAQETGR